MSDLSNLLGDVYGDHSSPDGPPVRHEAPASERAYEISTPRAPEWSSESQLDRAFSGWVPGEAPRAGDDDLAAALSAALRSPEPVAAPAPAPVAPVMAAPAPAPVAAPSLAESLAEMAPAPAPRAAWTAPINLTATAPEPAMAMAGVSAAPVAAWTRGDDDIFPMSKKGKRKK